MFTQVLAIDVAERVDNFADEMRKISRQPPVILRSLADLDLASAQNIDAIAVSIYIDVSEAFLAPFKNLAYIGILGSSTKKIALEYCAQKNIKVSNVVEYCDHETAEWVILQTLKFFRDKDQPQSCFEKSMGVVGGGAVGRNVVKLALALGMTVRFNSQKSDESLTAMGAQFSSKEEIFENCDVISFHTPAHFSWLDGELLRRLGKNAMLINTCMGEIASSPMLAEFLQQRPDVTLVMDAVAGKSYPTLGHFVDKNPAFLTPESQKKLQEKFLANFCS